MSGITHACIDVAHARDRHPLCAQSVEYGWVACVVHRGRCPVVTRVALRTFCRASYDPMFLRRLSLQEPHQAWVKRLVGIAQSAGDDLFHGYGRISQVGGLTIDTAAMEGQQVISLFCAFTGDNNFVSSVDAR